MTSSIVKHWGFRNQCYRKWNCKRGTHRQRCRPSIQQLVPPVRDPPPKKKRDPLTPTSPPNAASPLGSLRSPALAAALLTARPAALRLLAGWRMLLLTAMLQQRWARRRACGLECTHRIATVDFVVH